MFADTELARIVRPSPVLYFVTTPSDRLATALSGRYRLERELGQGGMAEKLFHSKDGLAQWIESTSDARASGRK